MAIIVIHHYIQHEVHMAIIAIYHSSTHIHCKHKPK